VRQNVLNPLQLSDTQPLLPAPMWGVRFAQGFGAIKRDGTRDPLPLYDARGLAPAAGGPALESDAGRYRAQPWGSETVILPWGEGLAELNLPSTDPAKEMVVLKHVAGDTFRYQRDDGTLGAEAMFQRDAAGRVSSVRVWGQTSPRLGH
jgi:hypothetical protein